jgi:gamma-glutamylcyclotransferase (GGCT)/AIG2-like uncharacterized protein YtfP
MRLFVYGTLQSGEGNHRLLRTSRLLGVRRTDARYTLVSLGAFPALLEGGATSVVGELYEVDGDTLAAVDRLEGHPHLYRRERVQLLGGERAEGYLLAGGRRERTPVIRHGDWRRYRCESRS